MSENDYPDTTVLTGIADGLAERLANSGFHDIMDIANAKEYEISLEVKGVGNEKASGFIEEAKEILDEEYFTNRTYDPVSQEYVDKEPDVFRCSYCPQSFNERSVWRVHQERCDNNPKND